MNWTETKNLNLVEAWILNLKSAFGRRLDENPNLESYRRFFLSLFEILNQSLGRDWIR